MHTTVVRVDVELDELIHVGRLPTIVTSAATVVGIGQVAEGSGAEEGGTSDDLAHLPIVRVDHGPEHIGE